MIGTSNGLPRATARQAPVRPWKDQRDRTDAVPDRVIERLGPMPAGSLRAMVDYGLSDAEIGRYYGVSILSIQRLRTAFGISGSN